jgi:signal transduction histidine kinase
VISARYPAVPISPMKVRDGTTDSAALGGATRPMLSPDRDGFRTEQTSRRFVLGAALGVGIVSFLATELMRYLLVPDIGRARERLLAEGLSALIVSGLTAKLVHISRERHRLMMARMQVIAEMNHHIRNALSPISLSLDAAADEPLKRVISESVDRIDWALREVLPREIPLGKEQRHKLGYFQRHNNPPG